jgi:hypothetical protein
MYNEMGGDAAFYIYESSGNYYKLFFITPYDRIIFKDMNLKKRKNILKTIYKGASSLFRSAIGIMKKEIKEEKKPLVLSPAPVNENIIDKDRIENVSVLNGDGDIPLWIRESHAPYIPENKLKRKILNAIKDKNRAEKIVKNNQRKTLSEALKTKTESNSIDEIIRLRKEYRTALSLKEEAESKLKNGNEHPAKEIPKAPHIDEIA